MGEISSSKTKAQILDAYRKLASELEEQRRANSKLQRELAEKARTVQKANTHVEVGGGIEKNCGSTR